MALCAPMSTPRYICRPCVYSVKGPPMATFSPLSIEKPPKPSKAALRQLLRRHMLECMESMVLSPVAAHEHYAETSDESGAGRPAVVYQWEAYVR